MSVNNVMDSAATRVHHALANKQRQLRHGALATQVVGRLLLSTTDTDG